MTWSKLIEVGAYEVLKVQQVNSKAAQNEVNSEVKRMTLSKLVELDASEVLKA